MITLWVPGDHHVLALLPSESQSRFLPMLLGNAFSGRSVRGMVQFSEGSHEDGDWQWPKRSERN